MREIKFRAVAKCKYNYHTHNRQCGVKEGDFVYGFYYRDVLDNEDSGSYFHVDYIRIKYGDNYGDIEVDGDTIGEFTGMHDKNGVPIYEGDVLLNENNYYWAVSFLDGKFIAHGPNTIYNFVDLDDYQFNVVGNIHQHAHLLEQNKC